MLEPEAVIYPVCQNLVGICYSIKDTPHILKCLLVFLSQGFSNMS